VESTASTEMGSDTLGFSLTRQVSHPYPHSHLPGPQCCEGEELAQCSIAKGCGHVIVIHSPYLLGFTSHTLLHSHTLAHTPRTHTHTHAPHTCTHSTHSHTHTPPHTLPQEGTVSLVRFSPDERCLAVVSGGGHVCFWELNLQELQGISKVTLVGIKLHVSTSGVPSHLEIW